MRQKNKTKPITDVSAVSRDIVWIAGRERYTAITADRGKTWLDIETGSWAFRSAISAVDVSHPWIAAENSVYKTVDGGRSWTKLNPPDGPGFGSGIFDVKFIDRNHGFVLSTFGFIGQWILHVTNDGGAHWRMVPIPSNLSGNEMRDSLSMHVLDANILALVSSAGYIYRTEDGGFTFSQARVFDANVGGNSVVTGCLKFLDAQNGFLAVGRRILVSHDGGRSWGEILAANSFEDLSFCDFVDPSNGWFLNPRGSVVKASAL